MSYTVDAVSKAIELLFLVAEEGGKGVTELARLSGNTKARAFRLLTTLEESGLVRRQTPMATYSLGYRALIIGSAAQAQLSLISVAKDILEPIGRECNESVLVRIRDGAETVCVAWWDAPHALRVQSVGGPPAVVRGRIGQAAAGARARGHPGRRVERQAGTFHAQHHRQAHRAQARIEENPGRRLQHLLLEKSDDMVAVAAPSAMPAVRSSPRCR